VTDSAGSDDDVKMNVPLQVAAKRMRHDDKTRLHAGNSPATFTPSPALAAFGTGSSRY